MAKVTIVDKNDEVVGSEERSEVYKKGLIHRLIRVLLFNKKGQLLLQWRSKEEDTFPETWDQSAGGHVDADEEYEVAAYRELEEELGVSDAKLTMIDKFYTSGEIGEKKINRFNAVFVAEYDKNDFVLQKEEVEKVKWFDIDELYNLVDTDPDKFTHGLISILRDYKDKFYDFKSSATQ